MDAIQDLIEEAKLRTLWWALIIFAVAYFLSHTSSSMWMNLPVSVLLVSALRVLSKEVELRWKSRDSAPSVSYLSHLERKRKQLSVSDSRLTVGQPPSKWKRKIGSPVVEAAIGDFIDKILKDFVVDLWYSDITPDREGPELMYSVIMDAIGEVCGRVKEINLVNLLTRDVVNLIGDHLELFRRNQAAIGVDVMMTLSSEERDERLKHHLTNSKELHPALVSLESEYKVLKRLVSGLLAIVLRPREAQCPLVRAIARELVTCLVMQPIMDLASPWYTNELIESILLAIIDDSPKEQGGNNSRMGTPGGEATSSNSMSLNYQRNGLLNDKCNMNLRVDYPRETPLDMSYQQEHTQPLPGDWARKLEVATQRRTEILAPENLENMWTKGRNYKKKENKKMKLGGQQAIDTEDTVVRLTNHLIHDGLLGHENKNVRLSGENDKHSLVLEKGYAGDQFEISNNLPVIERKCKIKRSISTSALEEQQEKKMVETGDTGGQIISEFYSPNFGKHREDNVVKKVPDMALRSGGSQVPKLKCRVVGAYFEKLGSKSFAVYSIAVSDVENRTWFVKRRYRNFERLHRHLKDIPNYTLHLPPKRIFSSSTEDAFVHQRCIQLDKYLQDLLSIANVAEQHEVWDFLSVSSKNYSFGKSSSVMKTLAVNVDDAVDDIVRQFKGVSGGLRRTIVGSSSQFDDANSSTHSRNLSWHADDVNRYVSRLGILETANINSENEESNLQYYPGQDEDDVSSRANGWHSDNELNAKGLPPRVIKRDEEPKLLDPDESTPTQKSNFTKRVASPATTALVPTDHIEDPVGMPPEWTPSNVSVPLLNLVDKVFQLNRRGWLRRQVFWISKQILQLIMEDAIDDWILQQICWVRREETVAQGIRWVKDVLWPGGTFFTRDAEIKIDKSEQKLIPFQVSQFGGNKASGQVSFEEQLEAARKVSNIKKMLFDGAPAALVSLIGHKQYRRCASDIFYFTQSTICLKQLAYAILELLLVSVFPELRDLVLELHEETRVLPK